MNLFVKDCRIFGGTRGSITVANGTIAKVSSEDTPDSSDYEVIDARGGTVVPGFIDTHCHPFEFGMLKRSVDLRGVANITGLRARLSEGVRKARAGDWVVGRGWDQELFPSRKMPARSDIDDISKNNPVLLVRVCGHIGLLNTSAITTLSLEEREGPEYERDATGALTGIVKEGALGEAEGRIPGRTVQSCIDDLAAFEFEAARNGVSTAHSIVSSDWYKEELEAIAVLASSESNALRYKLFIPPEAMEHVNGLVEKGHFSRSKVRLNGVKIYTDGSLGARTAALREPYSDDPGNLGLLRYSDEELDALVEKCDGLGHQVIIHAIGDRAVEQATSALSLVSGNRNPLRHRIEHASVLPKDLMSKMKKHSIRAAVQPCFVTSDSWAVARLGEERAKDLYPFRSMLGAGMVVSGGSDSPVESVSPVIGMWASMVRLGGADPESIRLEEAMDLYTANASSNGRETEDVTVHEGGVGTLTILDSDLEGIHPALLRKVGVAATVVEGRVVYSYEGSA